LCFFGGVGVFFNMCVVLCAMLTHVIRVYVAYNCIYIRREHKKLWTIFYPPSSHKSWRNIRYVCVCV
jgi:hypothetical protein